MKKPLVVIALVAVLAALALTGGGVASGARLHAAAKAKTVTVGDDFYSPKKLTVKRKTTVKWVWKNADGSSTTDHTHSVVDDKGRFASQEQDSGTFKFKFKKPGKYNIYCSVHPDTMKMKVTVKK